MPLYAREYRFWIASISLQRIPLFIVANERSSSFELRTVLSPDGTACNDLGKSTLMTFSNSLGTTHALFHEYFLVFPQEASAKCWDWREWSLSAQVVPSFNYGKGLDPCMTLLATATPSARLSMLSSDMCVNYSCG